VEPVERQVLVERADRAARRRPQGISHVRLGHLVPAAEDDAAAAKVRAVAAADDDAHGHVALRDLGAVHRAQRRALRADAVVAVHDEDVQARHRAEALRQRLAPVDAPPDAHGRAREGLHAEDDGLAVLHHLAAPGRQVRRGALHELPRRALGPPRRQVAERAADGVRGPPAEGREAQERPGHPRRRVSGTSQREQQPSSSFHRQSRFFLGLSV
jgi:ribosomal protein L20A (L18A)